MNDAKFIYTYLKNFGKGMLPPPIVALVETIDECKSEEELKEKFKEIKEAINIIKSSFPTIPIVFESEYASIIAIYYHVSCSNSYIINNPQSVKERIEEFLKNELTVDEKLLNGYLESLDVVSVNSDCIIIQNDEPVLKQDWHNGIISIIRNILENDFDTKIKCIAFA